MAVLGFAQPKYSLLLGVFIDLNFELLLYLCNLTNTNFLQTQTISVFCFEKMILNSLPPLSFIRIEFDFLEINLKKKNYTTYYIYVKKLSLYFFTWIEIKNLWRKISLEQWKVHSFVSWNLILFLLHFLDLWQPHQMENVNVYLQMWLIPLELVALVMI